MNHASGKLANAIRERGLGEIECTPWRESIRLQGLVDGYGQKIMAGKIAAKAGYKGVINDIAARGVVEPPMSAPPAKDASLHNRQADVLIIGGGVIGCAIAREMAKYAVSVLLLEKESDLAMHTSSRNDGMIHPGIASKPGTLRASCNVRGNAMYTRLTQELDIPFRRVGNLILYRSPTLTVPLGLYFGTRALKMGIEGRRLSKAKLYALEPGLMDGLAGGYWYPSTGILCPYQLTVALAENAVENGVEVRLETAALGMELSGGAITGVRTNRGTVRPRVVINAAGVFADQVAGMAGDRFFSIHPRKGEVVILDKKKGHLLHACMGVVDAAMRHSDTKGGGVIPTIDGNVLVGPDAYEQPFREDFSTNADRITAVMEKHLPLVKGLSPGDVITYFSGIRAATYEEDFIIERSGFVRNLIHAAGIQSPGLASAPAIAEDIVRLAVAALGEKMEVRENPAFNPVRRSRPRLASMSFEQKQAAIRENPDYGVILCRCEGISKGEVIDAIRSPVPALSLDAVKRRVRPGMGRCQGGFCSPQVAKLIAREADVELEDVTKCGGGSRLLLAKTPKGRPGNETAV